MRKHTKLFSNTSIKSLDEENRTATFIISTDDVDRYNEIVDQSWKLDAYNKNPIVLFGHNPTNPNYVLGTSSDIKTYKEGDRTLTSAVVHFAEAGTSEGVDTIWSLVKQGILKTVSVGFIAHTFKDTDDMDTKADLVLADNELLEFSIVPIPANPEAVSLAYGDGSIEEKDAKWLVKQYKAESEFLEKSLYDNMKSNRDNKESGKVKEMTDEDKKAMAEAIDEAVSKAVTPLEEKLDKALTALAEKDGEGAGDDEGADDKGKEGDDPAKAEHDDEAGAGEEADDVEVDADEELDEDAQKAFVAQLEKEYKDEEDEGKE